MTRQDKDILIAKIDTLRDSFSDAQMQAIMTTMRDLVCSIKTEDGEIGFMGGKDD